jgi:hypothetical protein
MPVQQVPWKSIYLAGGLLIAGAFTWCSPACLCGPWWSAEAPVGLRDAACPALLPAQPRRRGSRLLGRHRPQPLRPCPCCCSQQCLLAGLTMFISGMVLWRTEGTEALIGLWVLGLLVFIPGFYFTCAPGCDCFALHGLLAPPSQPSRTHLLLRFASPCSLSGKAQSHQPARFLWPLPSSVPLCCPAGVLPTWCTAGAGDTPGTTSQSSLPCRKS